MLSWLPHDYVMKQHDLVHAAFRRNNEAEARSRLVPLSRLSPTGSRVSPTHRLSLFSSMGVLPARNIRTLLRKRLFAVHY